MTITNMNKRYMAVLVIFVNRIKQKYQKKIFIMNLFQQYESFSSYIDEGDDSDDEECKDEGDLEYGNQTDSSNDNDDTDGEFFF